MGREGVVDHSKECGFYSTCNRKPPEALNRGMIESGLHSKRNDCGYYVEIRMENYQEVRRICSHPVER